MFPFAWLLIGALGAQELRISPVTASRGTPTPAPIAFAPAAKNQITALQWDLVFPEAQIHIRDGDWAAAKGALAAGKSLSCVRQLRRQPAGFAYRCILAGGNKPVPRGSVAVVTIVAVGPAGARGPILRLENVVAASSSAKSLALASAEASVSIR